MRVRQRCINTRFAILLVVARFASSHMFDVLGTEHPHPLAVPVRVRPVPPRFVVHSAHLARLPTATR